MNRPLDDIDVLAIDRAAAALALTLHSEHHAAKLADEARGALLTDIARGRIFSPTEIAQRARGLGADIDDRVLGAFVIEPKGSIDHVGGADRRRLISDIRHDTTETLTGAGISGITTVIENAVLGMLAVPRARGSVRTMLDAGHEIRDRVLDRRGVEVVVGFAEADDLGSLRLAIERAGDAAAFGLRDRSGPGVYPFEELGINPLLARMADDPGFARFIDAELRPLLDHDASSSSPLIPTLATYIRCGGNKAETARTLHLERRSLYYRLDRIRRILGRDPDDPDTQVRLQLAVRGLEILDPGSPTT